MLKHKHNLATFFFLSQTHTHTILFFHLTYTNTHTLISSFSLSRELIHFFNSQSFSFLSHTHSFSHSHTHSLYLFFYTHIFLTYLHTHTRTTFFPLSLAHTILVSHSITHSFSYSLIHTCSHTLKTSRTHVPSFPTLKISIKYDVTYNKIFSCFKLFLSLDCHL